MKSRLVALALAAVMTLGSCMSASAKEVFTKNMIGATVVKNGSYVENVKLIDVAIWASAVGDSFYKWDKDLNRLVISTATVNQASGNAKVLNDITVNIPNLTTEKQLILEQIMQNYGQTVAKTTAPDTAATAQYQAGWSYANWVASMQIAPYAERYIVAMNYKQLYKALKEAMEKAVAQGQIMASDAYANGSDYKTIKNSLSIVDATGVTTSATFSGATLVINGINTGVINDWDDVAAPAINTTAYFSSTGAVELPANVIRLPGGAQYVLYQAFAGNVVNGAVVTSVTAGAQYVAVPVNGSVINPVTIRYYDPTTRTLVGKTIPKGNAVDAFARLVDMNGTNTVFPIEALLATTQYGAKTYQEDADNALEIAKEMKAQFATAQKYYEDEEKAGVAYLITKVRSDLSSVTAANIDTCYGFDLDPYNELKWELKEKKTIAITSPSINDNMKETQSCVVLHFNTTACKWEAIDAKFVKYNGVLGVEGDFTSASPVIVVTLKDFVDNGAAAAATATDAKKSPHTGEEF